MEQVKQRGSIFGPVLLIGLGILLLLSNIGLISMNVWELLFRFWPVLLIAIGLDVLFGRRRGIGAIIALVVLLLVVAGSFWGGPLGGNITAAGAGETRTIAQHLDGATAAEVRIAPGVSQLYIRALPAGADDMLIQGTVQPLRNERLEESASERGDTAIYSLRTAATGASLPFWNTRNQGRWDLQLNAETSLDLNVDAGVGQATLDLAQLNLAALNVDIGVGSTEITLPDRGSFTGNISGGVGQLTLVVPDTLPIRIRASAGLGSVDVQGDFTRDGKVYTSSGYASADQPVEMEISGGVGEIEIRQVARR